MKPLLFVLIAGFFFTSCEDSLLQEEYTNTPTGVYNAFWSEFDQFYGAFEAKNINWDSMKLAASKGLDNSSSSKELFDALSKLLASLNDGHSALFANEHGSFSSWNRRNKSFFKDINSMSGVHANSIFNVIIKNYLHDKYKSDISSKFFFFYGIIAYHNKNIGYLYIPTFNGSDFPIDFIRQAASDFQECDAIVIDVRFNPGGTTDNFTAAMDMFTSASRLYLKSKLRNGHNHSDFTNYIDHYSHPHPQACKNKPIALLANSYSGSSAEHFILGLKSQDDVILVGDTTHGAFSEVHQRILPNGWVYQIGAQVVYTVDGNLFLNSKGEYIEGNGLEPDYYMPDYYYAVFSGGDLPLNKALAELRKKLSQ